jgi:hypothetical protein
MDQLGPEAAQRGANARVYGSELYLGIGGKGTLETRWIGTPS